jgi:hypothetical protein
MNDPMIEAAFERAAVVKRSPALRRVAVLGCTLRSREYARRALRALGYAPRVFSSLDDFSALGCQGMPKLELLILGDLPETDDQGRPIAAWLQAAVDPRLPMLHLSLTQPIRTRSQRAAIPAPFVATTSPRFFGQLLGAIQTFLAVHRFESNSVALAWGGHAFDPCALTVSFAGQVVPLDAVAFDVALEFFFNAGEVLSAQWLRRMLPTGERGAHWHRIDNLACTVEDLRYALQLHEPHRWVLASVGDELYRLRQLPPVQPRDASAPRKPRLERPGAPLVHPP